MIVNLEFRKFKQEIVRYQKDGKEATFERRVVMFEDEDGDQVELRFQDLEPFRGLDKGSWVQVSFKTNDKGLVVDGKFVAKGKGPSIAVLPKIA